MGHRERYSATGQVEDRRLWYLQGLVCGASIGIMGFHGFHGFDPTWDFQVLESTCAFAKTTIGTPYYLSPEICNSDI